MSDRATKAEKPKSGSQTRKRSKLAAMPCTPAELEDVKSRAEKAGLRVSGYLRFLVFGKEADQPRAASRPVVEKEKLVELSAELNRVGNNINQIAKHLNQAKGFDGDFFAANFAKYESILDQINEALSGRRKK
jgi:Bacterial mobilisation protein (MobC)